MSNQNYCRAQGDFSVKFQNSKGGDQSINFNLCSHVYRKCNSSSQEADEDFANIFSATTGQCHHLSLDDMDEGEASYINKENPAYGISFTFASDENCTEGYTPEPYKFTIDVRCKADAVNPIPRIVTSSVSTNSCHPKVYLESDAGKAFNIVINALA
jgi:hypothetical protein